MARGPGGLAALGARVGGISVPGGLAAWCGGAGTPGDGRNQPRLPALLGSGESRPFYFCILLFYFFFKYNCIDLREEGRRGRGGGRETSMMISQTLCGHPEPTRDSALSLPRCAADRGTKRPQRPSTPPLCPRQGLPSPLLLLALPSPHSRCSSLPTPLPAPSAPASTSPAPGCSHQGCAALSVSMCQTGGRRTPTPGGLVCGVHGQAQFAGTRST